MSSLISSKVRVSVRVLFVVFIDIAVLALFLFRHQAMSFFVNYLPDCIFYRHGIVCPACGMTRCVGSFLAGDFATSFTYNPFGFIGIIYLFVLVLLLNLSNLMNSKFAERTLKIAFSPAVILAMLLCYVLFGVGRNFI